MVGTDVSYQIFRARLFDLEPRTGSGKAKRPATGAWFLGNRDLNRRTLVADLLRSAEMWDEKALLLVQKELTAIALQEQEVIAAFVRMALSKLKGRSERLAIADEVLRLVAEEEGKAEPDPVVFHNGCLLLYDLQCEMQFSQYADRYETLIEQAYGLDEKDLAGMKKELSAGPWIERSVRAYEPNH